VNHKFVLGEQAASLLVAWLNGPGDQRWKEWRHHFHEVFGVLLADSQSVDVEARDRVIDLLNNVHQATEIRVELEGLEGPDYSRRMSLLKFIGRQINERLEIYRTHPMVRLRELTLDYRGKTFKDRRSASSAKTTQSPLDWTARSVAAGISSQELIALRFIQLGDQESWLPQVRSCLLCRKWFFAVRLRSRCCSHLCTKRLFQKSLKYREWRKTYYEYVKRRERGGRRDTRKGQKR
jgi:hypothetical protein